MPEVALHWEKHFQWALGKYNRTHEKQMPKITPHVCRHTYCSNMAKAEAKARLEAEKKVNEVKAKALAEKKAAEEAAKAAAEAPAEEATEAPAEEAPAAEATAE